MLRTLAPLPVRQLRMWTIADVERSVVRKGCLMGTVAGAPPYSDEIGGKDGSTIDSSNGRGT